MSEEQATYTVPATEEVALAKKEAFDKAGPVNIFCPLYGGQCSRKCPAVQPPFKTKRLIEGKYGHYAMDWQCGCPTIIGAQ